MSYELPTTTEEIVEMSKKYNFFTWSPQKNLNPMAIKSGEGCYYYDYDGNKYFDGGSQLVNLNIGFQNEKVVKAIQNQAAKLCYAAPKNTTDVRAALGKKIIEDVAPSNMSKVLLTLAGSDANEYAIRIAKAFTGRTKIFSQYMSYHGSTYGSCNLTGTAERGSGDPQISGFIKYFGPDWRNMGIDFKDEDEKVDYLLRMLRQQIILEGPERVAAIFIESMQGGGGAVMVPTRYMQGIRDICDEYGIVMVCDEVMVGFGRTGEWFTVNHTGVQPDLITFAKGVTCGYVPLGGVLVSKKIAEYFDDHKLPCGLTYNAHAISCAAALATIEVYEEEHLLENCRLRGEQLLKGLIELDAKHPSVESPRGKGLLAGVDFIPKLRGADVFATMNKMYKERGITIVNSAPGKMLFAPPLIVSEEEIDMLLKAADEVLDYIDTLV